MKTSAPSIVCPMKMIAQGEGRFLAVPEKPVDKLTIRQAARFAGVSKQTIGRLIDEGCITAERPSPHKTLVHADSLQAHMDRTKDAEYWTRRATLGIVPEP